MKWSERDETGPEQVWKAMIEFAVMIEEEEANQALDEEINRKRWLGKLELRDKKADQHRSTRGGPARGGVKSGGETRNPWLKKGNAEHVDPLRHGFPGLHEAEDWWSQEGENVQ